MLFPHHGQGRKAKLMRDLQKRKWPALLILWKDTLARAGWYEPFEDISVAGEE